MLTVDVRPGKVGRERRKGRQPLGQFIEPPLELGRVLPGVARHAVRGPGLALDQFHPNRNGYAAIAARIEQLIP